ncbi:MAG: hypothetical protein HYZ72_02675 [Deltaproteobacteria bacterium]|nr:hypothetical protein [Deltaproteobacteria bacterium]
MKTKWSVWCLALVSLAAVPGWAVDHNNLDEGRPLRLEDAYPIAYGELSVETGPRFSLNRRSADRFSFPVEILYGAYWNLHLGLGSTPATEPRTIDEPEKSGDLRTFALYNFNQETLRLPALAAKVSLNFPTGVRSRGVDTELKAMVTRSFGPTRMHLNVGYEFLGSTHNSKRNGRYEVVLGVQYPLGYPRHFNTTLLADIFTQQAVRSGESNPTGIEVGIRRQIVPLVVIDAGVGTEFAGPAERAPFFATVGVSAGF